MRHRRSVAWSKWRELNNLLSNKAITLKHRARAYMACIRFIMIYGAATWALTKQSCHRRMLRRMCVLSLTDWVPSTDIPRRYGLKDILLTVRSSRMDWLSHTYRCDDKTMTYCLVNQIEAPGRRPRG